MSSEFIGKVIYHILEIIFYILMFVPPVILIWRYRCVGFFAGFPSFLMIYFVAITIMTKQFIVGLNSEITTEFVYSGRGSIFHPRPNDSFAVLIVWMLFDFIYCGGILAVRLWLKDF
jgi:hypothetical protein